MDHVFPLLFHSKFAFLELTRNKIGAPTLVNLLLDGNKTNSEASFYSDKRSNRVGGLIFPFGLLLAEIIDTTLGSPNMKLWCRSCSSRKMQFPKKKKIGQN